MDDDDLLNPPIKPLFKKKHVKGKSLRKTKIDINDNDDDNHHHSIAHKWKSKKPAFVKHDTKTSSILKWTPSHPATEDDGLPSDTVDANKYKEGDIINDEDDNDDNNDQPKKYVPKLQDNLLQTLSHKAFLNQVTNEYDKDQEDLEIDDNYATIDPEPTNDLPLNLDDEMVNDEEQELRQKLDIDDEKYDLQIGDSDDDQPYSDSHHPRLIKVMEPLTIPQELERLNNVLTSLSLQQQTNRTELDIHKTQLITLDDRKSKLFHQLLEI